MDRSVKSAAMRCGLGEGFCRFFLGHCTDVSETVHRLVRPASRVSQSAKSWASNSKAWEFVLRKHSLQKLPGGLGQHSLEGAGGAHACRGGLLSWPCPRCPDSCGE